MYCLFQYRQYFSTSVQIEINPFAFSLFILNLIFPKFSDIITYFMFSCWLVSYTMGIAGLPAYFLLNIFTESMLTICLNWNVITLMANWTSILNLSFFLFYFLFTLVRWFCYFFIFLEFNLFSSVLFWLLFSFFDTSFTYSAFYIFQLHFSSYLSSLAPLQVPISSFLVDISSIFISSLFALV